MQRKQRPFVPPCAGVRTEEISWTPDWAELEYQKFLNAKLLYERDWLEAARKECALIACVIDRDARETALEDWNQRTERFKLEQAAKLGEEDRRQIAAYLAAAQKELDRPAYTAMVARVEKAGKEIKRDAAALEREVLRRRGVYKGR